MDFAREIDMDKIKLNRPTRIEMDLFVSFLNVDVSRPEGSWLGKDDGWTKIGFNIGSI